MWAFMPCAASSCTCMPYPNALHNQCYHCFRVAASRSTRSMRPLCGGTIHVCMHMHEYIYVSWSFHVCSRVCASLSVHVYVCMFVCMCLCVCVCVHMFVTCMRVYCVCMHACLYVCTHVRKDVCVRVCVHVCTYVFMCASIAHV